MPSDSKETKLGSSGQKASPSAAKNTGVVLVPSSHMEVHPLQLLPILWIFRRSLGVICYNRWVLNESQGLVSHELTAYLSIFNLFKLNNELWPYYQKHVNQIILKCTTLWSLALQTFETFVPILLIVTLSLNQTLPTFLLCERQTWMTQLILAIYLWDLPLIRKDCSTHMHGLRVYVKKGTSLCTGLTSRKICRFLLMFSTGFT